MNRSIKSLILAVGVAVAATTLTVAPAHADPVGPGNLGTVQPGPVVDPKPDPQVEGPGDIVNPPHCTHGCGPAEPPKDIANPAPADKPQPPADKPASKPAEDPAGDAPVDQGCFTGCDLPDAPAAPTQAAPPTGDASPSTVDPNPEKPSAADLLDRAEATAPAGSHAHSDLPLWLALSGTGIGALILAAVARRRRQQAYAA